MEQAMVTARMSPQKKKAGNDVLANNGMNASQAINIMYTKLIEERSVGFLDEAPNVSQAKVKLAVDFIDTLVMPLEPRFLQMTDDQIRQERLMSRGLM